MKRISIAVLLMVIAAGAAHAEPLMVKPGLWETTTITEKRGNKNPTNLDSLTPEQRLKVEKELASRAKKETHMVISCLKADKINSGEAFLGGGHHSACARKATKQTATDLEGSIDCKGANPMTGTVSMHAKDSEHMTGRIDMIYGPPSRLQLFTRSEVTAKWLGSDCTKAVPMKGGNKLSN